MIIRLFVRLFIRLFIHLMNTTTVAHFQQIETWAEYYLLSNVLSLVHVSLPP